MASSVRVRTTVGAVVVVALALGIGAVVLVGLQRDALRDGVESSAEDRASALADQIEADGLPSSLGEDDGDDDEDVVVQVTDGSGAVVLGAERLPDDGYVVVSEDAESGGQEYDVRVAASLDDVEESTAALVPLLLIGVPLLLVVVGATTWAVVTRALSPVERIRREVETIGDERLDRRVPVPRARDEIHRLATTM
ncbi:MAG TPA: HAMP domain-containing protein, partial [Nocardioides sp.]|nr:HAMP domain-containing protein [Nocardioides sp.]